MQVTSKQYQEHPVFADLSQYKGFYEGLSYTVMRFITLGVQSIYNIDTYMFSSMQGTIDSISVLLQRGRINDVYSLLRKFYDSAIINIYTNLYLNETAGLDMLIVDKINGWFKGASKMPEFRVMSEYIRKSQSVMEINDLLYKDATYKSLRERCNDYTHYNYYKNVLANDNEVHISARIKLLDQLQQDIRNVYILHCAYLFYFNEHYMASTNYSDAIDCGIEPEEGAQYYVAAFIQDAFDTTIKIHRPDIAAVIKKKTSLQLQ